MLSTDLGACEWFVWDLRRSNLIDRGQLDQVIGEFLNIHPGAEPPALAEFLVSKGVLTQFQAERLLQGKTQGFVLGPYTLMDALGSGSMGTVYKAHSKNDNRWYAVKVLPRRSMWNVRIARRKVRAFEQAQHASVVPFVDVGTSGGMHYLVWPLVEGQTLERVVQNHSHLDVGLAAHYALQTAEGLDSCHQQGLFHGQLKPSNIMIGPDGQLYILDFGIGCLLAETEGESLVDTMSTANAVASGLDCASPESIMDPSSLTPVGDQYSLGCVLYFCLTGRYPFPDGTAVEKMMAHQTKQAKPIKELNAEVPDELVAIVNRLMAKSPAERFGSTTEVIEALRPFARARPVAAPAAAPAVVRPAPRSPAAREPRPERAPKAEAPAAENPRPPSRPAAPAPRPAAAAARPGTPAPSRGSSNGAAAPVRQAQPAPANSVPVAAAVPAEPTRQGIRAQVFDSDEDQSGRSWDERLGPIGIVAVTVMICVAAFVLWNILMSGF